MLEPIFGPLLSMPPIMPRRYSSAPATFEISPATCHSDFCLRKKGYASSREIGNKNGSIPI
jgi:hypothetical protein